MGPFTFLSHINQRGPSGHCWAGGDRWGQVCRALSGQLQAHSQPQGKAPPSGLATPSLCCLSHLPPGLPAGSWELSYLILASLQGPRTAKPASHRMADPFPERPRTLPTPGAWARGDSFRAQGGGAPRPQPPSGLGRPPPSRTLAEPGAQSRGNRTVRLRHCLGTPAPWGTQFENHVMGTAGSSLNRNPSPRRTGALSIWPSGVL